MRRDRLTLANDDPDGRNGRIARGVPRPSRGRFYCHRAVLRLEPSPSQLGGTCRRSRPRRGLVDLPVVAAGAADGGRSVRTREDIHRRRAGQCSGHPLHVRRGRPAGALEQEAGGDDGLLRRGVVAHAHDRLVSRRRSGLHCGKNAQGAHRGLRGRGSHAGYQGRDADSLFLHRSPPGPRRQEVPCGHGDRHQPANGGGRGHSPQRDALSDPFSQRHRRHFHYQERRAQRLQLHGDAHLRLSARN